jgi:hypothetical protein
LIVIQYRYDWIISKQSLIELFTRLPERYQEEPQVKQSVLNTNNCPRQESEVSSGSICIWDYYHPNGMEFTNEQLLELQSDFMQWIKQGQFSSPLNSSSSSLSVQYFSFRLFKEWFERKIFIVLKIMSIRPN